MVTQARLVTKELGWHHRSGTGPTCVFVHGLYAHAGVFAPLRDHLERCLQISSYTFSYMPGPGIVSLSARVRQLLGSVVEPSPIVLIGHSMGGLAVRHYALSAQLDPRVRRSISLAAPFSGTTRHRLVFGQARDDLRQDARILQPLREADPRHERVPHLTLAAAEDELIAPGAFPEYGEHQLIDGVGHNGILFDRDVFRHVEASVRLC